MLFLPEARCVCRQAAVKAAKILPLDGLARSKQDPINHGPGARYLYWPPPAGADAMASINLQRAQGPNHHAPFHAQQSTESNTAESDNRHGCWWVTVLWIAGAVQPGSQCAHAHDHDH